MQAFTKSPGTNQDDLASHRFIGPEGLVQRKSMLVTDTLLSSYTR